MVLLPSVFSFLSIITNLNLSNKKTIFLLIKILIAMRLESRIFYVKYAYMWIRSLVCYSVIYVNPLEQKLGVISCIQEPVCSLCLSICPHCLFDHPQLTCLIPREIVQLKGLYCVSATEGLELAFSSFIHCYSIIIFYLVFHIVYSTCTCFCCCSFIKVCLIKPLHTWQLDGCVCVCGLPCMVFVCIYYR